MQISIFPVSSLTPIMREFVQSTQRETMGGEDKIAMAVLAVAAYATQYCASLERSDGAIAPLGITLIGLAESGERKTTIFNRVFDPIYKFQDEIFSSEVRRKECYIAEHKLWAVRVKAAERAIGTASRKGIERNLDMEEAYRSLQLEEPTPPITATLIIQNATPQAILKSLTQRYPTSALISDDASSLLNGHAFRDLALLNALWDGRPEKKDLVNERIVSKWPTRLTTLLMIQPNEWAHFLKNRGQHAKDIGFLSRALVMRTTTTAGTRIIQDQFTFRQDGCAFSDRVRSLIQETHRRILEGKTELPAISMPPQTYQLWIQFYNEIEYACRHNGEFYNFKDFASKIPEQSLRIAAVLQYFETGYLRIEPQYLNAGISIARFFLTEHLEIFSKQTLAAPDKPDSEILFDYLVGRARSKKERFWTRGTILKSAPSILRKRPRQASSALDYLVQIKRVLRAENAQGKPLDEYSLNPEFSRALGEATPRWIPPINHCFNGHLHEPAMPSEARVRSAAYPSTPPGSRIP